MISIQLKKQLNAAQGKLLLDLYFQIKTGAFVSIYGKSGAGKTSLLQMIAGLLSPDAGEIICDDKTWFQSKTKLNLKPQQRSISYMFQEYALFPNMTVRENLLFALEKNQDLSIVDELIAITELHLLEHKKPEALSGGQQQRVALARALVRKPKILLLDEPFSALDEGIKTKLQEYILQLHAQYKMTCILVSHDREAHIKLSDRVLFMEDGSIQKEGTTADLFPKSTQHFQVEALITKIDKNIQQIEILVGKRISTISTKNRSIEHLSVGDTILISDPNFQGEITQL